MLSRILMFLQEVQLEYEETQPDWRKTYASVDLMNSVRAKAGSGEAALMPPIFAAQELAFMESLTKTGGRARNRFLSD